MKCHDSESTLAVHLRCLSAWHASVGHNKLFNACERLYSLYRSHKSGLLHVDDPIHRSSVVHQYSNVLRLLSCFEDLQPHPRMQGH